MRTLYMDDFFCLSVLTLVQKRAVYTGLRQVSPRSYRMNFPSILGQVDRFPLGPAGAAHGFDTFSFHPLAPQTRQLGLFLIRCDSVTCWIQDHQLTSSSAIRSCSFSSLSIVLEVARRLRLLLRGSGSRSLSALGSSARMSMILHDSMNDYTTLTRFDYAHGLE